jgi:trigger factor
VVRSLVEQTWAEAVTSEDLKPVAMPSVSPEKLEAGKVFRYEARVEVRPEVEAKDYKGLEYTPREAQVSDEMVADELERMRQQLASLVPVEDRTVLATGDYAVVDYVASKDGSPVEGGSAEDVTMKVDEGSFLEGNAPMLAGVAVGGTAETQVELPLDFPQEALRGQQVTFAITVRSIKRREIPELDDEFAKDLGGEAKTIDALRAEVRQRMEKAEADRSERENRTKLMTALVEKNPFEVPKAMVERAIDMQLAGAAERFAQQGFDIREAGIDFRKLREDLRADATTRVKAGLLMESIADKEKLEVSDEDLEAHYRTLGAQLGMPEAKVRAHFDRSESELRSLKAHLREEKAVALLLREAKVVR